MDDLAREALVRVADARRNADAAREEYIAAVKAADAYGLSPTVIAHHAGLTEAAIRQTLKRHP